jgi:hypothetical protein
MYHVKSRGGQRDEIFFGDVDRHGFTKTLVEVFEMCRNGGLFDLISLDLAGDRNSCGEARG